MSVSQPVQFGDIKHCVVCGKIAVVHGEAIRCCPQFNLSDKDECAALLNSYARDGMMKFCYSCGADMMVEEDFIFCGSCQDTQNFDVPPRIQLCDIQHCTICAKALRRTNNGLICGRECNFRVVVSGTQSAMSRLTEYAIKGRVKFCYACGSEANGDALHVVCSQNNCLSCKIPLQESSTGDVQTSERLRSISNIPNTGANSVIAAPSESGASIQPVLIPTLGSMVARAYQRLTDNVELMLYKVSSYEVYRDGNKKIEKVEIGPKCLNPAMPNKVLMILGQTGVGKSTLINAIVNYIFDIKWEDSFRFVLIPESKIQTQSQTQCITAYTFHLVQGSNITFNLTVIDTPGFGDTQGLEMDQRLIDQIQEFFSTPAEYGIDHLDGIALTVKAHDSRLTHTQRYIFHSVMSIFGKDVGANIFIMATHADGGTPKVFEALKSENIPIDKTFIFNNSALFTPSHSVNQLSKMFWDIGVNSMKSFLTEFLNVESKSLTLTKEVLKDRKQLEVCIQGLQQKITEGLSKISCLKQEKKILREHKESMNASKNFKYIVVVHKQKLVELECGQFVTNCLTCNRTCHFPCSINRDEDKDKCAAMKPQGDRAKAACTVCPGKCSWEKHANFPKRYVDYSEHEVRTYEDLEKRYQQAMKGKCTKEAIVKRITAEKRQLENDVFSCIQEAHSCIQNLDKIALKPNPLSQVQYIELLIQAEKSDPRPGWQDRVQQFERAKEAAQIMTHIKGQTIEAFLKERGFTEEDLSDDDTPTGQPSKLPKKSQCQIS